MANSKYIFLDEFCEYHAVKISFLHELGEHQLVEINRQSSRPCVSEDQIPHLEKMIRMNRDLDLNVPGIEVALNLLDEIDRHKSRIIELENRLRRFE